MLSQEIIPILTAAREHGWVLEPQAKKLLAMRGIQVPRFQWARTKAELLAAAREIGYPVVAKVVSPAIVHKSEHGGVVTGIADDVHLEQVMSRWEGLDGFEGVVVEETVSGLELIIGAKIDVQFGPVVLLGLGGTGVEIYQDTTLRMAPLAANDVTSMISSLKARPLLEGYRGRPPVNQQALTDTLLRFSELVMDLADRITSIDLNPVFCSPERCVVADARIMLADGPGSGQVGWGAS